MADSSRRSDATAVTASPNFSSGTPTTRQSYLGSAIKGFKSAVKDGDDAAKQNKVAQDATEDSVKGATSAESVKKEDKV